LRAARAGGLIQAGLEVAAGYREAALRTHPQRPARE